MVARHRVQHARRRRLLGVGDELLHGVECLAVGGAIELRVDRGGDRLASRHHFLRPVVEIRAAAVALEREARLAAAHRDTLQVAPHFVDLLRRVGRAVAHQALQQERIQEAAGLRRDADRAERIKVHQPDLDIFHPPFA